MFLPDSAQGSPPHTRGILRVCPCPRLCSRITPACAGNTVTGQQTHGQSRNHPRIRGEHLVDDSIYHFDFGSPPHTRGILCSSVPGFRPSGITPAYAGNTRLLLPPSGQSEDHPRICGEYVASALYCMAMLGSPPLTRGTCRR